MWRVTEFPAGQPPRSSVAHDPKEVAQLLRLEPQDGHYTIDRITTPPLALGGPGEPG